MRGSAILRGIALAATFLAVLIGIPASAFAASCSTGPVVPAAEQAMLRQINAHRSSNGIAPLRPSPELTAAGRRSARKMARGADFAHDGLAWARGRRGAQNIAMAPAVGHAVRAMMRSAPHRRNLLNKRLRFAGIGAARDCSGQIYFTVNLVG